MNSNAQNKAQKFWDRTASSYDREEKKDKKTFLRIMERSRGYLKPTDTVLDFGCGTGLFSNVLSKCVKNIHAIDISGKMIELAQAKAQQGKIQNIAYKQATIFDDRLKTGSYGVILSFYILHLLEDPQAALRKMHDLLKPGGILISVTPCMGEKPLLSALFSLFSKTGIVPRIKSFKHHELEQLFTEAGFIMTENDKLGKTSNQYLMVAKKNK